MDAFERPIEDLRRLRGKKWRQFGDDVIPCWVADLDFLAPEPIRRYVARASELSDFGYPTDPPADPLIDVFVRRALERYDWTVDPARVEPMVDIVQGLYVAMLTYCEPGEGAVLQTPIYPPFRHAIEETGRRLVDNPLVRSADGWEIDFDHLDRVIDAGTRVFLLCNPHNPTGRVFTRAELERIAEIAIARDLVVIADEIHADILFDGRRHVAFATLGPEVEARTVTFNSATKAFNTAGLRCALAIFGSEALEARFKQIPRRVRGGLNAMAAAVTRIAWAECDDWREDMVRYVQGNRDRITAFLGNRLPEIEYRAPQATFLAWLDCTGLDLGEEAVDFFLREARVAPSRGPDFGAPGHVRVNFATSRAILDEILERMAGAVERHGA